MRPGRLEGNGPKFPERGGNRANGMRFLLPGGRVKNKPRRLCVGAERGLYRRGLFVRLILELRLNIELVSDGKYSAEIKIWNSVAGERRRGGEYKDITRRSSLRQTPVAPTNSRPDRETSSLVNCARPRLGRHYRASWNLAKFISSSAARVLRSSVINIYYTTD